MPLLSPGPMHNQSGSKLVGGFFGSWVRESGKKIHTVSEVLASPGVWSHPLYLNEKVLHTTLADVREVMPKCVTTVSLIWCM